MRVVKQLEAVDAVISTDRRNIYDDQTDPGNARSKLPENLEEPVLTSDSTVNASSDSASPTFIIT